MKKPNRIDRKDSPAPESAQSQATAETPAEMTPALIILEQEYQRIIGLNFESAVCDFDALADLIQHHPGFQKEVQAMRQIYAASRVLFTLQTRAEAL
jgi:hypothetical protein